MPIGDGMGPSIFSRPLSGPIPFLSLPSWYHLSSRFHVMEMKKENRSTESEDKARLAILELSHMMSVPMSLVAVIKMKVPEAIWEGGSNTPLTAPQILHRIRPQGGGDADNLQRILRMLTSYNIFAEHFSQTGERKYSLTHIGKTLVPDSQGLTYASFMLQHHQEELMRAWQLVGETVEDPTTEPFMKANGEGVLSYYNRREDARVLLGKSMQGMSIPFMRELLENYDGFHGVETVVDVGGNTGICLQMIMSKFPSVRNGINFDLPHSILSAPQIPGVTHVGGNAFDFVPEADAIFMKIEEVAEKGNCVVGMISLEKT
ncbi:hypothetical protein RJT34_00799 [Clitoria ternatea]|uniref:Caffeic acid O-methyltransferase n=1 Tax=Clitoria ternatea TaxID=43366 RepID=A0AAN9KIP6_CLITE